MALKPKKKVAKPRLAAVNGARTDDVAPWDDDEIPGVRSYDVSADADAIAPDAPKRGRSSSSSKAKQPYEPAPIGELTPEQAQFFATMNRLAERVSDLDQTYNGTAIREEVVRSLLAANLRLLPIAEQTYAAGRRDKDSYAWANLAQMNQSLIAEMNTMVTTEEQAARLITEVLAPAFEGVVAYVGAELGELQRNLASAENPQALQRMVRQKLAEFSRSFATYTQEAANKAETEIIRVLK